MPMVGMAINSVIFGARGSAIAFEHHREGAGLGHRLGIGLERGPAACLAARALKPPSLLNPCGVRPIWPITGMPRW